MLTDQLGARVRELGCTALVLSGDPKEGALIGDVRAVPRPPGRGVLVRRGEPGRLIQLAVEDRELSGASAGQS
jgi:S-DNA-T family DNA segregation ATPase FtsK/SpoIIIE